MDVIGRVLPFALLPFVATGIGGAIAAFRSPGPTLRSMIQHFAAGVVFSVAAVELLPDVVREHTPVEVGLSFAAGVALMLGLRAAAERAETRGGSETGVSWGLLAALGVDILIDGLLLGIGFAVGSREGILLAVALTLEGLSLGLASAATLRGSWGRRGAIGATVALGLLFVVGGVAGATALSGLSRHALDLVLAFGLAALLYLATEELLVEAHETPETPLTTAMFFIGFLIFLLLGMTGG